MVSKKDIFKEILGTTDMKITTGTLKATAGIKTNTVVKELTDISLGSDTNFQYKYKPHAK